MKFSYYKKLFLFIVTTLILLSANYVFAGLPDLTLDADDIIFSNNTPEPTEVIYISATIHNTGDLYYDNTPFEKHDSEEGSSSAGANIYFNTTCSSGSWLAQYFVPENDLYIGKISLYLRNQGINSDSMTLEIRKDKGTELEPGPTLVYLLASQTLISTFTTYGWQDFTFDTTPFLSAGTTYWICAENYVDDENNGYLWYIDVGTPVDMLAASKDGGISWNDAVGSYIAYFKVYKCTNTIVGCYKDDPDNGGELIGTNILHTPVPSGGSIISTFTWTAIAGSTDIYVTIDYPSPGIISESQENNNIAFKNINVFFMPPSIVSVSPANFSGVNINQPISVTFNEDMDPTSAVNSISVNVIQNNEGVVTDVPLTGTAGYTNKVLTFTASLNKGYKYKVTVSTDAEDLFGNNMAQEKIWTFTTVMDYTVSNTHSDSDTTVVLPPDILSDDYYLVIDTSPIIDQSLADKITLANSKLNKIKGVFSYPINESLRNLTIYKGPWQGTQYIDKFQNSVQITVPYTEQNNGLVLLSNGEIVKEKTLSLYYLDQDKNLWIKIPTSEVNQTNNTINATVYHFSIFAAIGENNTDLSNAYAYPVPWKPFDNNDETGTLTDGITFVNLGSQAAIRIYTISGELVRVLDYQYQGGEEQKNWDVKNSDGELLASGLYIYYIENEKEHKSGKIIVIK